MWVLPIHIPPIISAATKIDEAKSERDLGIVLTTGLKPNAQAAKAAARATSMAHRIKNTFHYLVLGMINQLYKCFIRPHLEFAVSSWNPYSTSEKKHTQKGSEKGIKDGAQP